MKAEDCSFVLIAQFLTIIHESSALLVTLTISHGKTLFTQQNDVVMYDLKHYICSRQHLI